MMAVCWWPFPVEGDHSHQSVIVNNPSDADSSSTHPAPPASSHQTCSRPTLGASRCWIRLVSGSAQPQNLLGSFSSYQYQKESCSFRDLERNGSTQLRLTEMRTRTSPSDTIHCLTAEKWHCSRVVRMDTADKSRLTNVGKWKALLTKQWVKWN